MAGEQLVDTDARVRDAFARVLEGELDSLPGTGLVTVIEESQRVISRMQAAQEAAIALLAIPGRAGDPDGLAKELAEQRARGERVDPGSLAEVREAADRLASAQVAAALTLAPLTGARRVADAVDLTENCPAVWAALREGRIDRYRAGLMCRETGMLEPQQRAKVIGTMLRRAPSLTGGQLSRQLQAAVIAADPEAARKRREEAVSRRRLTKTALGDGMGQFAALLPLDRVTAAWDVFDLIGHGLRGLVAGDERGIDACRADGFCDLIELLAAGDTASLAAVLARGAGFLEEKILDENQQQADGRGGSSESGMDAATPAASTESDSDQSDGSGTAQSLPGDLGAGTGDRHGENVSDLGGCCCGGGLPDNKVAVPTRQGRPVHLNVTLTLAALAKIAEDPAWINSFGAIDAEYARLIAEAAKSVTLLVTDQRGSPVGASERTYRPRQSLRDKVVTINPQCCFLGCSAPAVCCDLDHVEPFDHENPNLGGRTNISGLVPLCRSHHLLKTFGGWKYRRNPDGSWDFRSPLGRKYHRPAPEMSPGAAYFASLPDDPPF